MFCQQRDGVATKSSDRFFDRCTTLLYLRCERRIAVRNALACIEN
jgi:hypothetical protein